MTDPDTTGPAGTSRDVAITDVVSTDGVTLRVHETGKTGAPTVVCVHGYPDDHSVWDAVVAELATRYHVVSYDVRGAGRSGAPRGRQAYRLDQLAEDLAAVIDAVSPDRAVHLLGHDWGAVQSWHAVTGRRLRGRIASFTSISGPSLDHAGQWFRSRLRRPTPRGLLQLLRQASWSWYIGFFQLPLLPELLWRSGIAQRAMALLEPTDAPSVSDAVRGLQLYRANMLGKLSRPGSPTTDIPVQVLAPKRDPFVSVALQTDIRQWVPDLAVRELPGGHWLPRTAPHTVARAASELVDHVEGGPAARGLRRAWGSGQGRFADRLVVITGAGSGIGQACALEFAEQGADVVVTDIDADTAQQTATQAGAFGVGADAYQLDVSDRDAVERFAEVLRDEHGHPDIVINNAGIGMAGPFFDTTVAEWERIIDVNLWGVIHGCNVLGGLVVSGGEGGTIVNIASAAAYLPSKALPAYSTTKAAVLSLSQCLRGELADSGVGVVAVCPGFISTNITGTTRFVGLDPDQERAAQQRSTARFRRRDYPPRKVAKQILRAVERNVAIAPITPEARVGLVASRITPGLLRALARADLNR
jgi:NAD(P)-dependent dehydrogenase (short-subunit alcohol dehydrogenase family)/pimeloyl-ACP methyl ester carboxylesterase